MRWRSPSPEATHAAARNLAAVVDEPLVIALEGPLGAGKTVFVKGLAEGLGIDPGQVASPTFVIASEYPTAAGGTLGHVDLYRLESVAELDAAGFTDLLASARVVAVEWADRLPGALPADRLVVRLSRPPDGASERVLHAEGSGPVSRATLERWRKALA